MNSKGSRTGPHGTPNRPVELRINSGSKFQDRDTAAHNKMVYFLGNASYDQTMQLNCLLPSNCNLTHAQSIVFQHTATALLRYFICVVESLYAASEGFNTQNWIQGILENPYSIGRHSTGSQT